MKAVVITTAGGAKEFRIVSMSLKMVSGIACHCSSNYPLTNRIVWSKFYTGIVWPAVADEVEMNVWPAVAAGKVKPIIYKSFPLSEAGEAHRLIESSEHIGKILLVPLCR
ncbi:hypothetical protein V6N13_132366 [Hibiscus sabdariffa]